MKSSFLQPPEFLALPVFGLNISPNSLKIVKLKKKKEEFLPVFAEEIYFNETCNYFSQTDSIEDCNELKKIIKTLKKKHKINFVQISVPEEQTYVFGMPVPKDAIFLIDDFVKNNMDQYIPLTASEVYFDYKILKEHAETDNIPVIVTAIPRVIVEKYVSLFESCGIFVIACEPETHSIARCVINKGDNNPYIIININEYATSISVVEEGLVQYTQTVAIKASDIVPSMSLETTTLFKDTINKVIIYWFTSKEHFSQHTKIENIILTGKNIESSDLINFFESNLFVHVSFADVWKNCFDINVYVPNISKKDSLKYATCIGLSLFKTK